MDGLLRFLQVVVCGLAGRQDLPSREKFVTFLRERDNGTGIVFHCGDTRFPHETLTGQIFNIVLHAGAVAVVSELRQVFRGDNTKFADFGKHMNLRIAERVGLFAVDIFRTDTLSENGLNAFFARQWRSVFIGAFWLLLISLVGSLFLAVNLGEPVRVSQPEDAPRPTSRLESESRKSSGSNPRDITGQLQNTAGTATSKRVICG